MRGLIVKLVMTSALLAMPGPALTQGSAAVEAEKQVRQVIADYNAAYEKNDLDTYFKAFAPDLTQWFPSGRVDLPSYRSSWTKTIQGGGKNEKVDVRDLQVQVSPSADAAVATYILRVTFRTAKGVVSTEDNQETDVLFKRNGVWTIVHVNYQPAKTKP